MPFSIWIYHGPVSQGVTREHISVLSFKSDTSGNFSTLNIYNQKAMGRKTYHGEISTVSCLLWKRVNWLKGNKKQWICGRAQLAMMRFKALLIYLLKVKMCSKRNPSTLPKKLHGLKKTHSRNESTLFFLFFFFVKFALGFISVVPVAGQVLLQHSN